MATNFWGISVILLAAAAPLALWIARAAFPARHAQFLHTIGAIVHRMSRGRWTVAIGSAVLALALRACLLPLWPIPQPSVLDEFSYLLLGETFADGRLTNPPHPLWTHFETPLALQQPTYASVYPVVQGLYLAAGLRIAGHAWWGVWLSAGGMCIAVCWAVQCWLPPRWALFGALWVALQLALTSYWMNSYWGGAGSATGGALVIGAMGRLRTRWTVRSSLLLALGFAILANSRPYEGLLLASVAVAWLAWNATDRTLLFRSVAPCAASASAVLLATGILMAIYFASVTGHPLKMPSQLYADQYAAAPAFVWQKLPPEPVYRDPVMRDVNVAFLSDYHQYDTLRGALEFSASKLRALGTFYFGPLVLVPLLALPGLFRGRTRFLAVAAVIVLGGVLLVVPIQPHYGAPLTAALVILAVQALRAFWIARRFGNPFGEFLVPSAVAVCLAYIAFSATSPQPVTRLDSRPGVVQWLNEHGASHLVFVRYEPDHVPGDEWVHNAAAIDRSSIVWARDKGADGNAEVLRYYSNRTPWLLTPDVNPIQLAPYPQPR